MPYSIIHLETSVRKLEGKNLDKIDYLDFIVGGLLVDCSYNLNAHGIEISREDTHYHPGESYFNVNFPKNFLDREINNGNNNYLNRGYYFHLLTDKLYRDVEGKKITGKSDLEMKYLYEVYRKTNAYIDLQEFIEIFGQEAIDELYGYKINTTKLPKVFSTISQEILQKVYFKVLDNMTFKSHFIKYENEIKYYSINNGLVIINEDIKEKYNKYFSRKDYINMKNKVLEIEL